MNRKKLLIAIFTITCLAAGLMIWQPWQAEPFTGDFGPKDGQFRRAESKNLSPYAMFGDSSFVLMTEAERTGSHYIEIVNPDSADYVRIRMDFQTGRVTLTKRDGTEISFLLDATALARFISTDPLAEKYPGLSPYNYVANNPVYYIDPDGRELVVADEAQREIVLGYLREQLGADLFKFKKDGRLRLDKKAFRKVSGDFNEDQQAIANGFIEVIESNRTVEARLYENDDIDFSRNPRVVEYETYTEENGVEMHRPVYRPMYDGRGYVFPKLEQEGITFAVPGDDRAFSLVNRSRAKSGTFESEGGGQTNPCEGCIFIHEVLDHGLDYVRTGSTDEPQGATQKANVLFHNRSLRQQGSPIRTGADHQ